MGKTTRRTAAGLLGVFLFCAAAFVSAQEDAPRADKVSMNDDGAYNMKISPSVMSSRIYYEGSETLGRVGHEAILKRDIFHQIRKCFLVDCCVEGISIGSGVGGDLQEVFKRNTELPVQNTVNLSISYDNVLCFYAGNYRNRDYDEPIGTCRIPEQYRSQTVHVKITLNEEGIVEYVVLDKNRQVIYPRRVLS